MAKEKDLKKEKKVKKVKDVKKKPKKEKKNKEGLLKGVNKELKLVKWPSAKEIVKYTIATIVLCVVFIAFFQLLIAIMAYVIGAIK